MIYADSNFIVSLYVMRGHSPAAFAALRTLPPKQRAVPFTWLHQIEVINAFHRTAFLINKDANSALAATALLESDLAAHRRLAWVQTPLIRMQTLARQLTERHASKRGCRTYDVLHVAAAIALGADSFWTFDDDAGELAKAEELKIL
jgi:predicted nucleic acid-binding protein